MTRILLIEDDFDLRRTTRQNLVDEGFDVAEASTGEEGLAAFDRRPADCALVDLRLPGIDGFETCRSLRQRGDVPIIVVTARADTFDVVAGLEAGADDYVTKPFESKELVARIRALLRRVQGFPDDDAVIRLGDRVEIRPTEGLVRCDGVDVHLTRTEFRLLCQLAARPGRVHSRDVLLDTVWGYTHLGDTKVVDIHIHRLRSKIEADPTKPKHVVTVRGLGYKVQP